jgi:hypothetical protein
MVMQEILIALLSCSHYCQQQNWFDELNEAKLPWLIELITLLDKLIEVLTSIAKDRINSGATSQQEVDRIFENA